MFDKQIVVLVSKIYVIESNIKEKVNRRAFIQEQNEGITGKIQYFYLLRLS